MNKLRWHFMLIFFNLESLTESLSTFRMNALEILLHLNYK